MVLSSLVILFAGLAATYYVLVPYAVKRPMVASGRLFSEKIKPPEFKLNGQTLMMMVLMSAMLAFLFIFGRHDPNSLANILTTLNIVLLIVGVRVLLNSWAPALAAGAFLLLLVARGVGGVPFLDFANIFVFLGAFLLVATCFSPLGMKSFMVFFTAGDIFLVGTGVTPHVFPFIFELAPGHAFGFFYFSTMKVGCGDLMGLSMLAALTIREPSNRNLVFLTYALAFGVCAGVTLAGVVSAFPATVPLLPALLVHQVTRRRGAERMAPVICPAAITVPAA